MPPEPIRYDSIAIDLSNRFQRTTTVAASPSAGSETVIATLNLANFNDIAVVQGIFLSGWAAFTVGTSGASANLKVRQTNVSGSTIVATGATTGGITAGNLVELDCEGFDAGAGVGTYVLTLTVGSGAAASTVSALMLRAHII
jgi:hypothetical protein